MGRSMLRAAAITALAWVSACGDVGSLELDVVFPDEATEQTTRSLNIVVRESDGSGTGCDLVWSNAVPPAGARQSVAVTAYPNRNDVLAAAISLEYDALSLFVYAHPGIAVVETKDDGSMFQVLGEPLAGGCTEAIIDDPDSSQTIRIVLGFAPGPS